MEDTRVDRPTGSINAGSLNSVPEFHGSRAENAASWLNKFKRLASPSVYNWDDSTQLEVAKLRLCQEAAVWADSLHPDLCWAEFKQLFLDRFVEPIEEAMTRLSRCKQLEDESIQAYTDRFKSNARAAGREEDQALIHQYVINMRRDLRIEVCRQGTRTLRTIDDMAAFLRPWENMAIAEEEGQDYFDYRYRNFGRHSRSNYGRSNSQGHENVANKRDSFQARSSSRGQWGTRDRWSYNNSGDRTHRDSNDAPWGVQDSEVRHRPAFNSCNDAFRRDQPPRPSPLPQKDPNEQSPSMPSGRGESSLDEVTRQLEKLKLHMESELRFNQGDTDSCFNVFEECSGDSMILHEEATHTVPILPKSYDTWQEAIELCDHVMFLAKQKKHRISSLSGKYIPPNRRVRHQEHLEPRALTIIKSMPVAVEECFTGPAGSETIQDVEYYYSADTVSMVKSVCHENEVQLGSNCRSLDSHEKDIAPLINTSTDIPCALATKNAAAGQLVPSDQRTQVVDRPSSPAGINDEAIASQWRAIDPGSNTTPGLEVSMSDCPGTGGAGLCLEADVLADSQGIDRADMAPALSSIPGGLGAVSTLGSECIGAVEQLHLLSDTQIEDLTKEQANVMAAVSLQDGSYDSPFTYARGVAVEACGKEHGQHDNSAEDMMYACSALSHPVSTCKADVKVAKYGEPLTAIVDTGASRSAITTETLRMLGLLQHVEPIQSFYFNADGRKAQSLGTIRQVPVLLGSLHTNVTFRVTEALTYAVLLGMDFLKAAGAILDLRADSMLSP